MLPFLNYLLNCDHRYFYPPVNTIYTFEKILSKSLNLTYSSQLTSSSLLLSYRVPHVSGGPLFPWAQAGSLIHPSGFKRHISSFLCTIFPASGWSDQGEIHLHWFVWLCAQRHVSQTTLSLEFSRWKEAVPEFLAPATHSFVFDLHLSHGTGLPCVSRWAAGGSRAARVF